MRKNISRVLSSRLVSLERTLLIAQSATSPWSKVSLVCKLRYTTQDLRTALAVLWFYLITLRWTKLDRKERLSAVVLVRVIKNKVSAVVLMVRDSAVLITREASVLRVLLISPIGELDLAITIDARLKDMSTVVRNTKASVIMINRELIAPADAAETTINNNNSDRLLLLPIQ